MTRLWADFNEVFDDNYVWTSLRRTPQLEVDRLVPGAWVELSDDDQSTCWGVVRERSGPIITCQLVWSTWRDITSEFSIFPSTHSPSSSFDIVSYGLSLVA